METRIVKATQIIKQIKYITIASITPEGMPWNSPVYTAYDTNLNFYWFSWNKNQHSLNIKNNPHVFVTIYDSTVPEGTGVGVYFSGKAYELRNVREMFVGMTVCYKRVNKKMRAIKEFLKHFPRRVYKFVPEKAWINGDSDINGNYIDIRQELDLIKMKDQLT